MNRYIYVGPYMDGKCEYDIYYHKILDKFYKVPLNFTLEKNKESEDFEDPKIKPYEMTNPDEIKALKYFYLRDKKIFESEIIRETEEQEEQEKRRKRKFKIISGVILVGVILYVTYCSFNKVKELEDKRPTVLAEKTTDEEKKDEYLANLVLTIDSNETITEEVKKLLINNFNTLLSKDIYIKQNKVKTLCERIENYDFTSIDKTNYQDILSYLIFGDDNIVSKCFTTQLDEYVNNKNTSELSYLFGLLSSNVDYSLINHILYSDSTEFEKALAKHYNVEVSEISNLILLLGEYNNIFDMEERESIKKEYLDKIAKLYTNYYRENSWNNTLDSYIQTSEIYNGKTKIFNNLFSDNIEVESSTSEYGTFKMYFDRQDSTDVSKQMYYDKLAALIEEKGNNLDYYDPDCRFLLYLTILSYEDTIYSYYEDLTNNKSASELSYYMINSVFDESGFTKVNPEFLYSYFNNGTINLDDIKGEIHSVNEDTLSLALFKEYVACLRVELEEENITQNDYDYVLYYNLNRIKNTDEDLYNTLINYIESDTSIFTEFGLNPFKYEFKEGKILEYLYTSEKDE